MTRNRVSILTLAIALLSGGIIYRLADIQVLRSEKFRSLADRQHESRETELAMRGTIYDRRGRELAVTVRTQQLYVNTANVVDAHDASRRLATVLGTSAPALRRKIEGATRAHTRIWHGIDLDAARRLREMDLFHGDRPAFELEPEYRRSYPNGRLASHVVGFAGADLIGRSGIELALHDDLLGTPGHWKLKVDGRGGEILDEYVPPVDPHRDAVLTLDLVLQHTVERELDRTMRESDASAASAVLLDPRTGEILALANRPAPTLDRYGDSSAAVRRNRATYDCFEPGSTFKMFSAAALLETGRVRSDSRFDCERGRWKFRDRRLSDHEPFATLSFREVVEHSSNIGMAKASLRMPGDELRAVYERFGFGSTTGLETIEERGGGFSDVERNDVDRLWSTFGYGVEVTSVQLASAVGAIANDGVLVPPRIVRGFRDADGAWKPRPRPAPRRVISTATARTLTSILEGVVEHGTGTSAAVPGFQVAGKTGTSRRHTAGKGYTEGTYIASFAGFAPSDDPRAVLVVVVDTPQSSIYGGAIAAPTFSRIMSDVLAHLRVPALGADVVLLPDRGVPGGARAASTAGGSP